MDEVQAKRLLSLSEDYTQDELENNFQAQHQNISQRMASAPTEALKLKYQQQLDTLANAKSLLQQVDPVATKLSQTMMADLPGAAPSFTAAEGSVAGEGLNLASGTILANRYEIQERIGIGGMGAVFRAKDRTRSETVALKVMLPNLLRNEKAKNRFLNEARLSSNLSHPNIVNVYDVQTDGDLTFLSMELLEGQDLRGYLTALNGRPMALKDVLEIANPVLDALQYAHNHTVHRDVKPENIWLAEDGQYKLMDFGIARVQSTSQMTKTGTSLGTAYYMAPEQLKGTSNVDGRADQYSMAVMIYEMLTGNIPTGRIKSLREIDKKIPKKFSQAIDTALEPDPADRFKDILSFQKALSGAKIKSSSGGHGESSPWVPMLAFVAIVLIVGVFFGPAIKDALIPDPALQQNAIRLRAEVKVLQEQLEEQADQIEKNLRDLQTDTRRLESNLRTARSSEEKRKVQSQLNVKNRATYFASKELELAEEVVLERTSLATLEGETSLASSLISDKDYKQASENLKRIKADYENKLSQIESLESLVYRRDQAETMTQKLLARFNSSYRNSNYFSKTITYLDNQSREIQTAIIMGNFTEANQKLAERMNYVSEEDVWFSAWSTDSGQAYNNYIQTYPQGRYRAEALELTHEYFWSEAQRLASKTRTSFNKQTSGYKTYLDNFPSGKYRQQADEQVWNLATKSDSEAAFERYANLFPQGVHIAKVSGAKVEAAYRNAKQADNITTYRNFIKNYPDSKYLNEIKELEDDAAFKSARRQHTKNAYDRYLASYPNGKHHAEAKQQKLNAANASEQADYNSAITTGTISAYRQFLRNYPQSRFTDQILSKVGHVNVAQYIGRDSGRRDSELSVTSSGKLLLSGNTNKGTSSVKTNGLIEIRGSNQRDSDKVLGAGGTMALNDIIETSNKELVVVGKIQNRNNGDISLYVSRVKNDSNKTSVWSKTFNGLGASEAFSVIEDRENNLVITGSTYSDASSFDTWLLKLTPDGNQIWSSYYKTSGRDAGHDLTQLSDGSFLVVGYTTGLSTSLTKSKTRLLRVAPTGRLLWEKTFNSRSRNAGETITVMNNGNFLIQGYLYRSKRDQLDNQLLMEVDANGVLVWSKTINGYKSGDAIILSDGRIAEVSSQGMTAYLSIRTPRGALIKRKAININTNQSGNRQANNLVALGNQQLAISGTLGSDRTPYLWTTIMRPAQTSDLK